jgi:hypothetical protein
VKVTPSNQTLILANERPGLSGKSSMTLDQALNTAPGSVLQRVTIVAARPDTTLLYLRADYSSQTDSPSTPPDDSIAVDERADTIARTDAGTLVASSTPSRNSLMAQNIARRDTYGNPQTMNRAVEQYASTQRILVDGAEPVRVDVHA